MSALRAATFNRISHPSEADILANQKKGTREYVKGKGWRLVREYEEVQTSKGITPVLEEVLRAVERREFDVVVFTALSRMTRGGTKFGLTILERLAAAGCGWHFIENPAINYDSNVPEYVRTIILTIYAELDKEYRMRISRATKKTLDEQKAKGTYRGGAGSHKLPCRCAFHRRIAA